MTQRPRSHDQSAAHLGDRTAFQYAVKFLCGAASESDTDGNGVQQVTRGVFFTLINMHNPSSLKVALSWEAIVETRLGIALDPPQISGPRSIVINGSSAAKIDALDLFSVITGSSNVIIGGSALVVGYAVIISPIELDVTVLYTSRPQQGEVSSIDVKTVHPRTVTIARSADSGIMQPLQSRIARVTQRKLAQAFARFASVLEARSAPADFRGGFGGGGGGGGGAGRDFGGPGSGSPVPEPIPPEPTEPAPSPVPEPIPPEPTEPA